MDDEASVEISRSSRPDLGWRYVVVDCYQRKGTLCVGSIKQDAIRERYTGILGAVLNSTGDSSVSLFEVCYGDHLGSLSAVMHVVVIYSR